MCWTGLNVVGMGCAGLLGACFEAARAYEGVAVMVLSELLKLKLFKGLWLAWKQSQIRVT